MMSAEANELTPTSSGAMPVVAVQSLTKIFKDFWMRDRARAVDGVSFEINRGEIFGLLGPNGSGKSTTIKVLLGLLKPTSGRVAVFGKLPSDVTIKKRIGYLPEESYLYQFLNARETLEYYGRLFGITGEVLQRRTDELLDMIGLTGAQFRPVREYSKGMQRRIGIAQALINDPDFLILDEPTTGLDPIGNRQVKDLILELGRRGKTILLSSHLLSDVEDVVDRMVILYGGKIQAEGTCESLLESQSRTAIETDTLDEETIAEIDRLVRQRSGGSKSITRVTRPRQKLEELFMDIVEKARGSQSTSGATSGGATASFLRASEAGDALIEKLVKGEPEPAAQASVPQAAAPARAGEAAAPAPTDAAGTDLSVIGSLLQGKGARPQAPVVAPPPPREAPAPPASEQVDLSVIDSLLGDQKPGGDKGPERTP
jgi:ABC-2 type transport system ATP-binding protein